MDLEYIYGNDVGKEGFAKVNRNFSAVTVGVETPEGAQAKADTAKAEAIAGTQTWAKGVFTRKNLLIDGDFQLWLDGTTFTAPSNQYTATMWKCNGSGTVTKVANGMRITGTVTVQQIMEALEFDKISGKTVTLSYSLNGDVYTSTYITSSATVINLTVTDKIINWIKLEEGEFHTPFVSNPYKDELFSSQRYYLKNALGATWTYTTNAMGFIVSIPRRMRIVPTFTSSLILSTTGVSQTGFTLSVSNDTYTNFILFSAAKTSHGLTNARIAIDGIDARL